jgi:hypothetical protein
MNSVSDEKWWIFNCFSVRIGQIRRIGRVVKTMECQLGQFLLGCSRNCRVSRGIVVQEQDHLG